MRNVLSVVSWYAPCCFGQKWNEIKQLISYKIRVRCIYYCYYYLMLLVDWNYEKNKNKTKSCPRWKRRFDANACSLKIWIFNLLHCLRDLFGVCTRARILLLLLLRCVLLCSFSVHGKRWRRILIGFHVIIFFLFSISQKYFVFALSSFLTLFISRNNTNMADSY